MCVCICAGNQSCQTHCNPMDCSPLGSSVHGIFQARILEWVAISYSGGIFLTQGSNLHLLHLLHWQMSSLSLSHLRKLVPIEREAPKKEWNWYRRLLVTSAMYKHKEIFNSIIAVKEAPFWAYLLVSSVYLEKLF